MANEELDDCVKIVEFRSDLHPSLLHREVGQDIPVPSEGDGIELGDVSENQLEVNSSYVVTQRTFTYFENGFEEIDSDSVVRITLFLRNSKW